LLHFSSKKHNILDHIHWIPSSDGPDDWDWTAGNPQKIWKSRNNSAPKLEEFLESAKFIISKTLIFCLSQYYKLNKEILFKSWEGFEV
jgi:hypothetical protein